MALITTNSSPIRQYNPFTGLSATERSQSGIARAEVVYYQVNENWGQAGAGNQRLFQIPQTSLPQDFGYVLTDFYLEVHSTNTDNITTEMVGNLRVFPGGILGPVISLRASAKGGTQNSSGTTAIGSVNADAYNSIYPSIYGLESLIQYELDSKPTALIYPFNAAAYSSDPNPASLFDFGLGDPVANQSALEVTYYLRFLQYDIDQSYNYVIQSPQLTR